MGTFGGAGDCFIENKNKYQFLIPSLYNNDNLKSYIIYN